MNIGEQLNDFIKQAERVLNVTHKPQGAEFKQIAVSTAIGVAVVGIIGFIITMASVLLRG